MSSFLWRGQDNRRLFNQSLTAAEIERRAELRKKKSEPILPTFGESSPSPKRLARITNPIVLWLVLATIVAIMTYLIFF